MTNSILNKKSLKFIILALFYFSFLITAPVTQAQDVTQNLATASSSDQVKEILMGCNNPDSDHVDDVTLKLSRYEPDTPPSEGAPLFSIITDNCDPISFTLTAKKEYGTNQGYYFNNTAIPNVYIHVRDGYFVGDNWTAITFQEDSNQVFKDEYNTNKIYLEPDNTLDKIQAWFDENGSRLSEYNVSNENIIGSTIGDSIAQGLEIILELINGIIVGIINGLAWFINLLLIVDIRQSAVEQGWIIVRDAANILLVVGLLLIAGFNAARYQLEAYTAKALIPRLVLAAIFINFSFLLTTVLIEFGNVLTQYFMGDAVFTEIIDVGGVESLLSGAGIIAAGIALYAFTGFIALSVLIGFVILVAILIFRWVLLCILAIFSPLVFLFGVMPFTRGLTGQWWNYLIRYTFMGAIIGLLLNVAANINFG